MTSMRYFNSTTDARWNDDHSAATHLRNPVTLTWVDMKPPVPLEALCHDDEGCFWHRFGAWCLAAFSLGHCDPEEVTAGPVLAGRGGWITKVAVGPLLPEGSGRAQPRPWQHPVGSPCTPGGDGICGRGSRALP